MHAMDPSRAREVKNIVCGFGAIKCDGHSSAPTGRTIYNLQLGDGQSGGNYAIESWSNARRIQAALSQRADFGTASVHYVQGEVILGE